MRRRSGGSADRSGGRGLDHAGRLTGNFEEIVRTDYNGRRHTMASDDAIARLARQIKGNARADRRGLMSAGEVAGLRRAGAAELHSVCAAFVNSVNSQLSGLVLELSPADYPTGAFRESGANLIQISGQGRIVQIAFESTRELFSTEKHLIPYTLEGEIRTYNEEMLKHFEIQSLGLFYCVEEERNVWRFADWLRNRHGVFSRELLANLMGDLF